MSIETHFDYDALQAIEYTREALRTLSVMTGALMEQGDSMKSYALGFEVLLDAQVDRLKEAEEMIRETYRSIKRSQKADEAVIASEAEIGADRLAKVEADLNLEPGTVQAVVDQLRAKRASSTTPRGRTATA